MIGHGESSERSCLVTTRNDATGNQKSTSAGGPLAKSARERIAAEDIQAAGVGVSLDCNRHQVHSERTTSSVKSTSISPSVPLSSITNPDKQKSAANRWTLGENMPRVRPARTAASKSAESADGSRTAHSPTPPISQPVAAVTQKYNGGLLR